ncbi:MAG: heme NO-binding domain-containing protein [Pararhodobacter sp.]|nr:heme NO-binding domain-containing protein [Pararhodobacter sp.]
MHGLINKAIQSFLVDTYGHEAWEQIRQQAGLASVLGAHGFEAMQTYDPRLTDAMIDSAVRALDRPRPSLLEDLGTYLVSNPRLAGLRRLLRFGGVSFTDFLHSLEELPGRTRLAVPELTLPDLITEETGPGCFNLTCRSCPPGFGHVMLGVLRALADDYGALTVAEHAGATCLPPHDRARRREQGLVDECIMIEVHDPAFHAGRRFDLAGVADT